MLLSMKASVVLVEREQSTTELAVGWKKSVVQFVQRCHSILNGGTVDAKSIKKERLVAFGNSVERGGCIASMHVCTDHREVRPHRINFPILFR